MRHLVLILCVLLAQASCMDRAPPAAQSGNSFNQVEPLVDLPGGWQQYAIAEAGFTIGLPSAPEKKSRVNEYDFGSVTITAYTSSPRDDVTWRVATHDYPTRFVAQTSPQGLLELMQDGMTSNVQGQAYNTGPLMFSTHPGRKFTVDTDNPFDGKSYATETRLFVVAERVYQISVTSPRGDAEAAQQKTAFFASFSLYAR